MSTPRTAPLCLLLSLLLAGCGGDSGGAASPDAYQPEDRGAVAGVDARSAADAAGARDTLTSDRGPSDTASGYTADRDTSTADAGGVAQEGARALVAWPIPGSALREVVLTGLEPGATLAGSHGHVLQCSQAPDGATFAFSAGGLKTSSRLCVPAEVQGADPEGDFDGIVPPSDLADLADDYAAVAAAYALQRAHEFYSGTHGWTDLDAEPVTAIVNVQHYLDSCKQWLGVPEGLFLPSGRSPGLGGELLHDGPVIALGQIGDVDMAHWMPVTVHEYGHAIMGQRLSRGAPAAFGASLDGLALAEGFCDYFSSAVTGHPVHADFGMSPGDELDYSPCGVPVARPYAWERRRDLNEALTCPESLTGQMHADGQILSSALWALRAELGESVDAVAIAAVKGFGASASLEDAAKTLIAQAQQLLDATAAARFSEVLTERGLTGCARVAAPEQIGARGHDMTFVPWLNISDAFGPAQGAPLQLALEVPQGAAELSLSMSVYTPQASPTVDLLLKRGEPVTFDFEPGRGLSHDAALTVPVKVTASGAASARFSGACVEAGTWYASILAREPGMRVRSVGVSTGPQTGSASPVRCAPPEVVGALGKSCSVETASLKPDPAEAGFWAAARLEPASLPFTVEAVAYQLSAGAGCSTGIGHRVIAFVGDSNRPAAEPSRLATWAIPSDQAVAGPRTRRLVLDEPRVLEDGEQLYVAVEMPIVDGQSLCLSVCPENDRSDTAWWSNAAAAPYGWVELESFGLKGEIRISALGHAGE